MSERKQTALWLVGTLLGAAFGVTVLFFGVRSTLKTLDFLEVTEQTDGVIVDFRGERYDGSTTYYPTLTFTDDTGEEQRFEAGLGKTGWDESIGDTLPVRYDPAGTHDPRIDTVLGVWITPALALLLGTGATLLCLPIGLICAHTLLKPDPTPPTPPPPSTKRDTLASESETTP